LSLASRARARALGISPRLLFSTAAVELVLLIYLYSVLFPAFSIPISNIPVNLLVGPWAVCAYCLIAAAGTARGFSPLKFDTTLFLMRYVKRLVQLFGVLVFMISIVSGSLFWASLLVIPIGISSYFFSQVARVRIRVRVRKGTVSRDLQTNQDSMERPAGAVVELLAVGRSIASLSLGTEEVSGTTSEAPMVKSSNENQWEVGVIPIQHLPCTVTVLDRKDTLRRFRVERGLVPPLTKLKVDIVVDNILRFPDEDVEMNMPVDSPLQEAVDLILKGRSSLVGQIDMNRVRVFMENRELHKELSLVENGLQDDAKIAVHTYSK